MLLLSITVVWLDASCGTLYPIEKAPFRPNPVMQGPDPSTRLTLYWIGHSTVLIRLGKRWIITDPFFVNTIDGVVQRLVEPGIDLSGLPDIDLVFISHVHKDHLDFSSLEKINSSASILLPTGGKRYMPKRLLTPTVEEISPWGCREIAGIKVTAVPVKHSGGRYFIDGVWNHSVTGYIFQADGITVFFGGDTSYQANLFKEIGQRFKIDLAIFPIGPAGQPEGANLLTKRIHTTPNEAMQAFEDLNARWMIPIHYGTLYFRNHKELARIRSAILQHGLMKKVFLLQIGQSVSFK